MGFSNEVKHSMETESDSTLQTSLTVVYLLEQVLGKLVLVILILYIAGTVALNVILKNTVLKRCTDPETQSSFKADKDV